MMCYHHHMYLNFYIKRSCNLFIHLVIPCTVPEKGLFSNPKDREIIKHINDILFHFLYSTFLLLAFFLCRKDQYCRL